MHIPRWVEEHAVNKFKVPAFAGLAADAFPTSEAYVSPPYLSPPPGCIYNLRGQALPLQGYVQCTTGFWQAKPAPTSASPSAIPLCHDSCPFH